MKLLLWLHSKFAVDDEEEQEQEEEEETHISAYKKGRDRGRKREKGSVNKKRSKKRIRRAKLDRGERGRLGEEERHS